MNKWEDPIEVKVLKNKQLEDFKANAVNGFKDGNTTVTNHLPGGQKVWDDGVDFGHMNIK